VLFALPFIAPPLIIHAFGTTRDELSAHCNLAELERRLSQLARRISR